MAKLQNGAETLPSRWALDHILVNFLKCVVTEVVLFSIVAFKTFDISQGSVATHFGCGVIFSDRIITNFLLIPVVI